MEIKKGIAVSPGYAVREAFLLDLEEYRIPERVVLPGEVDHELSRLQRGIDGARKEIDELRTRVLDDMGPDYARIFDFHKQILADPDLQDEIRARIRKDRFSAEYAVSRAMRKYRRAIQGIGDGYFAQRYHDIDDVEQRLLHNLLGERRESLRNLEKEVVIVARNLSPSQTADLDPAKVKGIATDAGGRTSHTAIVARALGIPAVVGLESLTTEISGGDVIVIDGNRGIVIVGPDESTREEYHIKERRFQELGAKLTRELHDLPAQTLDGHEIALYANVEFPHEIDVALDKGAEGIGLYRTEFIFTEARRIPTEEDHYGIYKDAVDRMAGRPVVFRTMDLGADKFMFDGLEPAGSGQAPNPEHNPFLGCRSIRYCFERQDIFKPQLRAILRASAFGDVRILFPMISSIEEIRKAKLILRDVMDELKRESVPFNPGIPVGVMIEVPSAAVVADVMVREVDFFSIGTNDLVQYALAVDRVNERVAPLYQPAHPAILRLVRNVVRAASAHDVQVTMCGEMSGEVVYTMLLVGLGIQSLSLTPAMIPEVKKVIRSLTFKEANRVTEEVMNFEDASETVDYLQERMSRILPQTV